MRHLLILCAVTPLLVACVPQQTDYVYKSGASLGTKDRDLVQCSVAAAREVPVNTQIGQTSTYVTPVQTSCYRTYGGVNCQSTGGDVYGGKIYSYDANSDVRRGFLDQCMASKGYSTATISQCPPNVIPENLAAVVGTSVRLPREGACSVAVNDRISTLLYPEEFRK
jgi:hypothetical protein